MMLYDAVAANAALQCSRTGRNVRGLTAGGNGCHAACDGDQLGPAGSQQVGFHLSGGDQRRSSAHETRLRMPQHSQASMAAALAALLIGLLAAGAGADDETSHGCPMCGASVEAASVEPASFQSCGIAGGGAAAWHDGFPLPDVPPPVPGTQQPAVGNGQAAEPLLDNPPSAEMCQALTAAVNAQVQGCKHASDVLSLPTVAPSSWSRMLQLRPQVAHKQGSAAPAVRLMLLPHLHWCRCRTCRAFRKVLKRLQRGQQDRAAHYERAFGADGGGLRCEALAAAAKAAMARAVALAAAPGPEQERLRRGRGRWHRSRLYHAMRQVQRRPRADSSCSRSSLLPVVSAGLHSCQLGLALLYCIMQQLECTA
jgi:hypothetical protein